MSEETYPPLPYYPYVMDWDRGGRKGQRCGVIQNARGYAKIQFEDGVQWVIDRRAVRHAKLSEKKIDAKQGPESKLAGSGQPPTGES